MKLSALAALALLIGLFGGGPAKAQDFGATFSGFGSGSDGPIQIEADRLEVRDSEKVAIYSGSVKVRQGETMLEAPELRVSYSGEVAPGAGTPGSKISRIEAGPQVVVRSPEQSASGDYAVLDMAQNLITMTGNVILTQGANVVRGDRFIFNTVTRQGSIEGGRVQTLITPSAVPPSMQ